VFTRVPLYFPPRLIGIYNRLVRVQEVKEWKKAGKPVRPGDVAKMIGEESKEVSKIISGLKKQGRVMSPKRCYYAPTEK